MQELEEAQDRKVRMGVGRGVKVCGNREIV